mmetsp:Transcript_4734/g.17762  ORF Transcript_4734/g.17762 Transcript_4734/m.17762 type:complete len:178 (-) Transcript_4734:3838-4371(-)
MFFIGLLFTGLKALVLNRLARKLYNAGKRFGVHVIKKFTARYWGKKTAAKLGKEEKPSEEKHIVATAKVSGDSKVPHIDATIPAGVEPGTIHFTLQRPETTLVNEEVQTSPSLFRYQQAAQDALDKAMKKADDDYDEVLKSSITSNGTSPESQMSESNVIKKTSPVDAVPEQLVTST